MNISRLPLSDEMPYNEMMFPGDWEPLDGSPAAREIAAHIAERARMAQEQERLFEADHSPDHFECGGTFYGFTCGSDADSGL